MHESTPGVIFFWLFRIHSILIQMQSNELCNAKQKQIFYCNWIVTDKSLFDVVKTCARMQTTAKWWWWWCQLKKLSISFLFYLFSLCRPNGVDNEIVYTPHYLFFCYIPDIFDTATQRSSILSNSINLSVLNRDAERPLFDGSPNLVKFKGYKQANGKLLGFL